MVVQVKHVLGDQELRQVQKLLAGADFQDGRLSAGRTAQTLKNNEEVSGEEVISELNEIVMGHLVRHPEYKIAALPHRVAVPFYVRYGQGMGYGEHLDDPVMGNENRYRSDIAITVFLNSPDDYEGGELVIDTPFGQQQIKYPAGDAVLYPASTRHQVTPVTRGERLVAVTWVQSLVRSYEQRDLLYQLGKMREKMLRQAPDSEDTRCLDTVYVNLVR
ncbi:MAG: Fe2+-dependent dioxygenase, partial [Gammaproteobacteria bacterium]|nr:Fe2+-dependent dioxygenase [Gammaproteobacteria bacterium]